LKVIEYIDQQNSDHKRRIRNSTMDFTDKLCSSSDKHCDEVKAYVLKSVGFVNPGSLEDRLSCPGSAQENNI